MGMQITIISQKLAVLLLGCSLVNVMANTSVKEFFPDVQGNLTKIVWAHAVNDQTLLNETLHNEKINMIEADVSLGKLNGKEEVIPIMAHPQADGKPLFSDLSLNDFLSEITQFNTNLTESYNSTKKGVKLDFKSIEAFEKSQEILLHFINVSFPIWLNADILPGPINSTVKPVDASLFLPIAQNFTNSVLSIGWTTNYNKNDTGAYTKEQIDQMIEVIKNHSITQEITFPVRAGLAAESTDLMKNLLDSISSSTLTIWQSSADDNVNIENLRNLIAAIGVKNTYIDVSENILDQIHLDNLPSAALSNVIPSILVMVTCLVISLS